jgi:hypothetical protein
MAQTHKHRKHRVVVEITTSRPVSDREAVSALKLVLIRTDKYAFPIWQNDGQIYIDKLDVKSFPRVLAAVGGG